jgi:hypothetical protein
MLLIAEAQDHAVTQLLPDDSFAVDAPSFAAFARIGTGTPARRHRARDIVGRTGSGVRSVPKQVRSVSDLHVQMHVQI